MRGSYREKAPIGQNNPNRQPLQQMQPRQVSQPHVLPQPANNLAPVQNPVPAPVIVQPLPSERQPGLAHPQPINQNAYNNRPCFACQQFGHFARECPNRDNAKVYKPANQQVNQITEPAQPNDMPRHTWSKVTTTPVTSTSELVVFCVNCAQTGHSFAACNQKEVPEEQVYALFLPRKGPYWPDQLEPPTSAATAT